MLFVSATLILRFLFRIVELLYPGAELRLVPGRRRLADEEGLSEVVDWDPGDARMEPRSSLRDEEGRLLSETTRVFWE